MNSKELKIANLVDRTLNPNCPACINKRLHTKLEWGEYHPAAGSGYSKEHGVPEPVFVNKEDKI